MRFTLLLFICLLPAYSQLLSVGVKAGVPITADFTQGDAPGGGSTSNDRYTVGPTVEIHLPFRLSFEADALYRHTGFNVGGEIGVFPNGNFSISDWQVPLLAKYEMPFGFKVAHPFADAGAVYRHISGSAAYPPSNSNSAGFAVGGGITLKLLHFRLEPEIRYTHWGQTVVDGFSIGANNQADFLLGFTF